MLGYKFSKLDYRDIIILMTLLIIVFISDVYLKVTDDYSIAGTIHFFALFAISFLTISSPIGLRFRNFFFSLIWLIICLIAYRITNDRMVPLLPVLSFLNYQIVRGIYWLKYKREFIPLLVSRTSIDLRFSKLENRNADKSDKTYMLALFIFGMITLMVYVIYVT